MQINEIERGRFNEMIDQYSDEYMDAENHTVCSMLIAHSECPGCLKGSLARVLKVYVQKMDAL